VLGKEHPSSLTSVSNLAWLLEVQGKHEELEQMYQRAVEGSDKLLGMEHPDTLIGVNNLTLVTAKARQVQGGGADKPTSPRGEGEGAGQESYALTISRWRGQSRRREAQRTIVHS